ncbi:MAG: hypothetical protein EOO40_13145 [Deltaproteobacteria bacterium]|nr:MAG: hypothetical protein EOO40_13145 [Deltaproteobacteria bacterium]
MMLKDFMLAVNSPSVLLTMGSAEGHGGADVADDLADHTSVAEPVAHQGAGQGACVVSLADGGTDVSTVVHLVHAIEVHATVEADLAGGGGPALDMTHSVAASGRRAGHETSSTGLTAVAHKHPRDA